MRAAFLLLVPLFNASAAQTPAFDAATRYTEMAEQSPFALATAAEEPVAPTESFAANWELVALAKLRNERGEEKDFVSIRSRDRRLSLNFTGNEESTEEETRGVSVQAVDWQEGSRKSTVTLKKGTELAKVEFSQESASPPPAGMPTGGAAGGANANQARVMQLQAQQARVQQMQQQQMQQQQQQFPNQKVQTGAYTPGVVNFGGNANGAPGGIQRPMMPNNGFVQPNQNVTNGGGATQFNNLNIAPTAPAIVYPQPPGVTSTTPLTPDPRRRQRIIKSQP